jgi:hypothetical protein
MPLPSFCNWGKKIKRGLTREDGMREEERRGREGEEEREGRRGGRRREERRRGRERREEGGGRRESVFSEENLLLSLDSCL